MDELTIREASQLIGRTPATIRRYIRSGRLKAAKDVGKFGEEYHIRREDLLALGFSPAEADERPSTDLVPASSAASELSPGVVPLALYNELFMKHEQILVQYGMIRAGGQKLLEYKAEAQARGEELRRVRERYEALRARAVREITLLRTRLRQSEARNEERKIEVTLLQERLQRLEAALATGESTDGLDARIVEIQKKERSIAELAGGDPRSPSRYEATESWAKGSPRGHRKEDH